MEISAFFCHSDFTWNQYLDILEVLTTGYFFMWSKIWKKMRSFEDQWLKKLREKRSPDFFEVSGAKNITWNRGFDILFVMRINDKTLWVNEVHTSSRWSQKYYMKTKFCSDVFEVGAKNITLNRDFAILFVMRINDDKITWKRRVDVFEVRSKILRETNLRFFYYSFAQNF